MKIIILGAGQVGATLAENLTYENHDIVLVDTDVKQLENIQQRTDLQTISGFAAHPSTLRRANAENADLLIAVTDNDETNMIACQIGYTLFNIPTRIARIRSSNYSSYKELFNSKVIPIDLTISPEELLTQTFQRLIECPGTMQVLDFADGRVQLLVVKINSQTNIVNKSLDDLKSLLPLREVKVAAVYRRKQAIALTDSTVFENGDEVFIFASQQQTQKILKNIGHMNDRSKRIIIAGGGNIGYRIAKKLEMSYQVKLIDHNADRAQWLAEHLDNTTVLNGDASDRDLLHNENIEYTDVFCAVTNDDEANIMSCLLAKKLGVKFTLALINRSAYLDLAEENLVDVAISPQQITIGRILTHIRHGDMVNVYSVRRDIAEAIEIIAHGDNKTSEVVGKAIAEIDWPRDTIIGAVVRADKSLTVNRELIIESDDHLIILVKNKKMVKDVEKLFQVNIGYFG